MNIKQYLIALLAGLLFGTGLCIPQMADPEKVLNFLDVTGNWDPSLLLVIGGGLLVSIISFSVILKRKHPLLSSQFYLPTNNKIDSKLLIGSSLFGAGWGMIGYCPGPAIAALGFGFTQALLVVIFILLGMKTSKLLFSE